MAEPLRLDFSTAPTVYEAIQSQAVVTGLMGPFGSGKSVGCSAWVMAGSEVVQPGYDGVKHTRYAVIRNTGPELKSTTIKTFTDQFPEGPHGRVVYTAPITYRMQFPRRGDQHGIDCEVIFIALDNARDVRKLLSLELTGAWVNEAREVPKPIIDMLPGRCGRYPAGRLGASIPPRIMMDTNAPEEGHWWSEVFDANVKPVRFTRPDGEVIELSYKLYRQPPAVLRLRALGHGRYAVDEGFEEHGRGWEWTEGEVISNRAPDGVVTYWGINPQAENLSNLEPTYYPALILNKDDDFIKVYAQGKYGYVREGRAVVPEFVHSLMVREFAVLEGVPLEIGVDIGGGTLMPAAVIGQRHPRGPWLIHSEVVAQDMGVENFARALRQHIASHYGDAKVLRVTTDPAAEVRDEIFETKINDHLRKQGFPVRPAPTNDWKVRRTAIAQPAARLVDGMPGLLVHKTGCPKLIEGLRGKWEFRRMAVLGQELYAEKPTKNEWSHPCEALGYLLSGGGEARVDTDRPPAHKRAWQRGWQQAGSFNVF